MVPMIAAITTAPTGISKATPLFDWFAFIPPDGFAVVDLVVVPVVGPVVPGVDVLPLPLPLKLVCPLISVINSSC